MVRGKKLSKDMTRFSKQSFCLEAVKIPFAEIKRRGWLYGRNFDQNIHKWTENIDKVRIFKVDI